MPLLFQQGQAYDTASTVARGARQTQDKRLAAHDAFLSQGTYHTCVVAVVLFGRFKRHRLLGVRSL